MVDKDFFESIIEYNKDYYKKYGYVPSLYDYSCTREEYKAALIKAVNESVEIDSLLLPYNGEGLR